MELKPAAVTIGLTHSLFLDTQTPCKTHKGEREKCLRSYRKGKSISVLFSCIVDNLIGRFSNAILYFVTTAEYPLLCTCFKLYYSRRALEEHKTYATSWAGINRAISLQ